MIQFRLWDDCSNNCTFCSLKYRRCFHTPQQLIERIDAFIQCLPDIEDKEVGLIGGELFMSLTPEFTDAWMRLVDAVNNSEIEMLYLATNLLDDFGLLMSVISALKKDFWICTSYDEKGRFFTEEDKKLWKKRLNVLFDTGYKVHCTMIPTQELITSELDLPDGLSCDICEPIKSPEWYWAVDKEHYHDELLKCTPVSLPKRKDMIHWFRDHPLTLAHYLLQENTHANNICEFRDNKFEDTYTGRFEKNRAPCGHQYWSRCYADSDKCMMCDAKIIRG